MQKTIKEVQKKRDEAVKRLGNPFAGGMQRNFLEGLIAGLDFILVADICKINKKNY